jgi:DNA replication protein DnaC
MIGDPRTRARDLLEIVEDRYDKGPVRFPSIPTLADAILDRVIHNAYRIELAGESLRKRRPSS